MGKSEIYKTGYVQATTYGRSSCRTALKVPEDIKQLIGAAAEFAADCRSRIVNAAAAPFQKLASVFDQQKKPAIKVELQPFCPEFFQSAVLCCIQLYRREPPAAVSLAAAAMITPVKRFVQEYAMPFDTFSSEKLHMVTSMSRD